MSYGWGPKLHDSRRRIRENAVRRVLGGEPVLNVAMSLQGVTQADVVDWVEQARVDAARQSGPTATGLQRRVDEEVQPDAPAR